MSSKVQLDPFVAQAQNDNVTPAQKIEGMCLLSGNYTRSHFRADLHKVIKGAQTGMLTTRASDGHLHARAMTPAGRELQYIYLDVLSHNIGHPAYSNSQVNLVFIANNASPKFLEIQNDNHVNVNFFDTATTHWASFSGTARVIEDRAVITKYWSPWYPFQQQPMVRLLTPV
jgi:general stress protein 26